MATFVMLGKYSQDSIKEISSDRTEEATAIITGLGGEASVGYALLGEYDLVIVTEFPSIENAMKASVELSKLLGISFTTSPAISIEEFDKLVG